MPTRTEQPQETLTQPITEGVTISLGLLIALISAIVIPGIAAWVHAQVRIALNKDRIMNLKEQITEMKKTVDKLHEDHQQTQKIMADIDKNQALTAQAVQTMATDVGEMKTSVQQFITHLMNKGTVQ